MKFNEASTKYLKYYEVTKSNGTYRFNKSKTDVLATYFRKKEVDMIDETAILELILFLRKKNPNIENATINKYIGVLKRIISHTTQRDIKFDKLPEVTKLVQIIPIALIKRIFTYLKRDSYPENLRNLVMFNLLLDTGLRISELLSLKISNIDFENKTIHVTETKTKVHRYVFFTERSHTLLSKYILKHRIKSTIFIKLQSRKPLSVDNVQKLCQRMTKTLKIDQSISPHKWRHTFATRFAEKNGNMEVLRMILGHTSLITTQLYLHVGADKLRSEYNKIVK